MLQMLELLIQDFISVFMENPLGQFFWIVASLALFLWFFQTNDRNSKLYIILSLVFWAIHFLLLGLFIPTITSVIALLKVGLSIKYEKNLYICLWIIVATAWFWIASFESTISSIPVIISVIWTVNFFYFHWIIYRLVHILNSVLWVIYSCVFNSIGWVISHTITIFILGIAIVRILNQTWYFHSHHIWKKRKNHPWRIDPSEFAPHYDWHRLIERKWYSEYIASKIKKLKK